MLDEMSWFLRYLQQRLVAEARQQEITRLRGELAARDADRLALQNSLCDCEGARAALTTRPGCGLGSPLLIADTASGWPRPDGMGGPWATVRRDEGQEERVGR